MFLQIPSILHPLWVLMSTISQGSAHSRECLSTTHYSPDLSFALCVHCLRYSVHYIYIFFHSVENSMMSSSHSRICATGIYHHTFMFIFDAIMQKLKFLTSAPVPFSFVNVLHWKFSSFKKRHSQLPKTSDQRKKGILASTCRGKTCHFRKKIP